MSHSKNINTVEESNVDESTLVKVHVSRYAHGKLRDSNKNPRKTHLRGLSLAAEDVVVARSSKDLNEAGEDAIAADLLVVVGADVGRRGRSRRLGVGGGSKGGGREGEGSGSNGELHVEELSWFFWRKLGFGRLVVEKC